VVDGRPRRAGRRGAPTLVVHNRDDQVIPASAGEELAALLPDARLHLLDGNEHDPFIRDAGSVVEVLLAFVDGRPLPTTTSVELPTPTLTPREREVLRLLASGATNDAIAAELAIAVKTVERHVTNLYRKLDARGRADATRAAVALGVVPAGPAGEPGTGSPSVRLREGPDGGCPASVASISTVVRDSGPERGR
jgi:DNA-binding CsgD family transcriptional regulator